MSLAVKTLGQTGKDSGAVWHSVGSSCVPLGLVARLATSLAIWRAHLGTPGEPQSPHHLVVSWGSQVRPGFSWRSYECLGLLVVASVRKLRRLVLLQSTLALLQPVQEQAQVQKQAQEL
jgi:hypothetical protein